MATTSIIADGTTELASSDFSLAAGESTTLSIRGSAGISSRVSIQFKDSASNYADFGELTSQNSVVVLSAIGTFRCVRRVSAVSFGVDRS